MAKPVQTFSLDHSIFNDRLYDGITGLWFGDIAKDATTANDSQMKKWYGSGSAEERADFDKECAKHTKHALDSIDSSRLTLPEFHSKEDDRRNSETLAAPFLGAVLSAQKESNRKAADTLLALVLLLDQMPRNIFRDQASLPKVYNHYDRLSLALIRSSLKLTPSPADDPFYAVKPVFKSWFFMPLMHSEDVTAHQLWKQKTLEMKQAVEANGDDQALKLIERSIQYEDMHYEPVKRFGRYPHRNICLGRESTPEELEHMKTGQTFGVQQGERSDQKDEL